MSNPKQEIIHKLRLVLSELYSGPTDAERIVADTGMGISNIDFGGKALNLSIRWEI